MPTNYSGNPANVTTPLVRTVTGCTGITGTGSNILVSTSPTPHLFANNDLVVISGVTGTVEANGSWYITVQSSTTFTLNGSSFAVAYGGGGTATDDSLTPYFQIPSNGDQPTVDVFNAALSALADRTQYLMTRSPPPLLFTTPGAFSFTTGPASTLILVTGIGGGSGGGGGAGGDVNNNFTGLSGGGGSGAVAYTRLIQVTPNTTYSGAIGSGGGSGAPGASIAVGGLTKTGSDGHVGTNTSITGVITFPGATTVGVGGSIGTGAVDGGPGTNVPPGTAGTGVSPGGGSGWPSTGGNSGVNGVGTSTVNGTVGGAASGFGAGGGGGGGGSKGGLAGASPGAGASGGGGSGGALMIAWLR